MAEAVIQLADEAKEIGADLIKNFHPHLAEARILFLFTDKRRKKCDRVKAGSAKKMGAMERFLASHFESVESGPDYLILLDSNEWAFMEPQQQRRLVDHELCHCKVYVKSGTNWVRLPENESKDDYADWKWGVVTHDIEDFKDIVERYGMPQVDTQEYEYAQAVQKALPGMRKLEAVV